MCRWETQRSIGGREPTCKVRGFTNSGKWGEGLNRMVSGGGKDVLN